MIVSDFGEELDVLELGVDVDLLVASLAPLAYRESDPVEGVIDLPATSIDMPVASGPVLVSSTLVESQDVPFIDDHGAPIDWFRRVRWIGEAGNNTTVELSFVKMSDASWQVAGGIIGDANGTLYDAHGTDDGFDLIQTPSRSADDIEATNSPDDETGTDQPNTVGEADVGVDAPDGDAMPGAAVPSSYGAYTGGNGYGPSLRLLGVRTSNVSAAQAAAYFATHVGFTNTAFDRSHSADAPTQRIELFLAAISSSAPTQNATSLVNDWDNLLGTGNPTIVANRLSVGADIVSLVVGVRTSSCGVGAPTEESGIPISAKTVTVNPDQWPACVGTRGLSHEIGHVLGAGHHPNTGAAAVDLGYYGDSRAHCADGFRSLMADALPCGNAGVRQLNYSNPQRTFYGTSTVSGTSTRNNARTISYTAAAIAGNQTQQCIVTGSTNLVTPKRYMDSRDGTGTTNAPFTAGTRRSLKVTGGAANIPTNAEAVLVNITTVEAAGNCYLAAQSWNSPARTAIPATSTSNWLAGEVVATATIVPVGESGNIDLFVQGGPVEVIVDVFGYVNGSTPINYYRPVTQKRIYGHTSIASGNNVEIAVAGSHGVPSNATGVVVNVSVVSPTASGHGRISPGGTATTTSNINFTAGGGSISNLVFSKIGTNGKIRLHTVGTATYRVDILGYYGPNGTHRYYPSPAGS